MLLLMRPVAESTPVVPGVPRLIATSATAGASREEPRPSTRTCVVYYIYKIQYNVQRRSLRRSAEPMRGQRCAGARSCSSGASACWFSTDPLAYQLMM